MDSCLNRNPDVPTIKEEECTENYDKGCVLLRNELVIIPA